MRFEFIRDHRETFGVGVMCDVLEVSTAGFYSWVGRPESAQSLETRRLTGVIKAIHNASRKTYGSPRVHAALRARAATAVASGQLTPIPALASASIQACIADARSTSP